MHDLNLQSTMFMALRDWLQGHTGRADILVNMCEGLPSILKTKANVDVGFVVFNVGTNAIANLELQNGILSFNCSINGIIYGASFSLNDVRGFMDSKVKGLVYPFNTIQAITNEGEYVFRVIEAITELPEQPVNVVLPDNVVNIFGKKACKK